MLIQVSPFKILDINATVERTIAVPGVISFPRLWVIRSIKQKALYFAGSNMVKPV